MPVRTSVHTMPASSLGRLRRALGAMMDVPDERGYQYFAGLHGLPIPSFCRHGDELILPWHRAYLYFFERALQDQDAGVTIPWWNWSSRRAHQEGLPPSHAAPTTEDGEPNPLHDSAVLLPQDQLDLVREHLPGALTEEDPPRTRREPGPPDELPRAATVRSILEAPTFEDFSTRIENVHNDVHGWAGGSMTAIPVAAFDPIFWSHHAMLDRLWYIWQMRHPGALPASDLLDVALPPFPLTVRQTMDASALGYGYSVKAR